MGTNDDSIYRVGMIPFGSVTFIQAYLAAESDHKLRHITGENQLRAVVETTFLALHQLSIT